MGTIDRMFGQRETSRENSKVKGGRRRAFGKFTAFLGALPFVLLLTSVTLPPDSHAAFPGANGKICFGSNRDGNSEIYVMNADGSGQTNLTNNPAEDGVCAWSADGTKIAFRSNRDGNFEIYVMNADGTGQTRLTNNSATDFEPYWSPDGTKIAFEHCILGGDCEVFVMNADGTGQTNLTNNPALLDRDPDWSPDGTKIAFFRGGVAYRRSG